MQFKIYVARYTQNAAPENNTSFTCQTPFKTIKSVLNMAYMIGHYPEKFGEKYVIRIDGAADAHVQAFLQLIRATISGTPYHGFPIQPEDVELFFDSPDSDEWKPIAISNDGFILMPLPGGDSLQYADFVNSYFSKLNTFTPPAYL